MNAAFSPRGATFIITTTGGNSFAPPYIDGQSANLLLNGKVLVAGGEGGDIGRFNTRGVVRRCFGPLRPRQQHDKGEGRTYCDVAARWQSPHGRRRELNLRQRRLLVLRHRISAELYDPVADAFAATGSMTTAREWHTATLLKSGDVLITGGLAYGGIGIYNGNTASAELYHPTSVSSAPVLFSLAGGGRGQGAVWDAMTGQLASPQTPAAALGILSMYVSGLAEGAVIPPQVAVGGQLADVLYFGDAPGYPGYYQVNFRMPGGVAPGLAVPVRLSYLGRPSNAVTIAVQ